MLLPLELQQPPSLHFISEYIKLEIVGVINNGIIHSCIFEIVVSCSTFYEKEAMLMDPVDGPILASLLGKPKDHQHRI